MKKISILLAAVLIVAFLMGSAPLAHAEEATGEEPTEEETVEVPKEIWEEILELLEQLKNAQSGDEVKDIVENTLGARIREYFGDSWGDVVLAGIFILASIVIALMNRKKNATLLAGVETVYKTAKSTAKRISKKEDDTALDEIITASADKSASSEKMSKAALEMIKLLVLQSNAKDTVKAEAEKLYQGAVTESEIQRGQ